jgi:hypothetical protein
MERPSGAFQGRPDGRRPERGSTILRLNPALTLPEEEDFADVTKFALKKAAGGMDSFAVEK